MTDLNLIMAPALLALNVFQLWFWSRMVHALIDKLMSRNYADYVQVNNSPDDAKGAPIDQGEAIEEKLILDELNSVLPR